MLHGHFLPFAMFCLYKLENAWGGQHRENPAINHDGTILSHQE